MTPTSITRPRVLLVAVFLVALGCDGTLRGDMSDPPPSTGGPGAGDPPAPPPPVDPGAPPPPGTLDYPPDAPAGLAPDTMVGTVLPNFAFQTVDGSTVTMADLRRDKKHRVIWWYSVAYWCQPCISHDKMKSIPLYNELVAAGAEILKVDTIAPDPKPPYAPEAYIQHWQMKTGAAHPVLQEPRMYMNQLMERVIGVEFVVEAETMKILYLARGGREISRAQLEMALKNAAPRSQ
jgi:hypothetical protein